MLGSPILYLKAMRILMFQLSGFYCRSFGFEGFRGPGEGSVCVAREAPWSPQGRRLERV